MRKNKVLLGSLGVGRCFTLPVEPGVLESQTQAADKSEDASKARIAKSILPAGDAWKITDTSDEGLACVSAGGEERSFPSETEVVEIPRQGFDTLASR